jgi:hypothetical protein
MVMVLFSPFSEEGGKRKEKGERGEKGEKKTQRRGKRRKNESALGEGRMSSCGAETESRFPSER